VDLPTSIQPNGQFNAPLDFHVGPGGRTAGAIGIEISWDPDELTVRDWSNFTSTLPWYGLRSLSEGWVRVVIARPAGLPDVGDLIVIPFRARGTAGTDAAVTLTVFEVIAASSFDDFTGEVVAPSTVVRIRQEVP
jgi:hypothetical protein